MQFSLKSLFLATTGVALLFALACTLPDIIALPLMAYITLILPAATIAMIVYGRGYVQAFAIGCGVSPVGPAIFAIPMVAVQLVFLSDDVDAMAEGVLMMKVAILAFHFINVSCGVVAVLVYWLIQRNRSKAKVNKAKSTDELIAHDMGSPTDEPYTVIQGRIPMIELPETPLVITTMTDKPVESRQS